ncbi:MAG TPA: ANTAR domain-containing protein [Nakamurella sp.]
MRIERTGGSDLPRELPTEQAPAMRRALICERDQATRTALGRILTDEGFEVAGEVGDARQAIELARQSRPNVVVLGIGPGTDGLEALAQISAERAAPVVVLATESTAEQVAGARDAGALAYLAKPPTRAALVPAVELAMARFADTAKLVAEVQAAGRRLESRKIIDRAKGLLMTHRRMSEPEAFRWIQRTAMDRRKTSVAVAAQVVADLGNDSRHRAAS